MKYRMIIQDMKESGDANVVAFLKDAEKIKPMSKSWWRNSFLISSGWHTPLAAMPRC